MGGRASSATAAAAAANSSSSSGAGASSSSLSSSLWERFKKRCIALAYSDSERLLRENKRVYWSMILFPNIISTAVDELLMYYVKGKTTWGLLCKKYGWFAATTTNSTPERK
jgi:hypothetical protein